MSIFLLQIKKLLRRLRGLPARLKSLFMSCFTENRLPMASPEEEALAKEVLDALDALKIAQARFDEARGEQVEWAVFALKAASTHYGSLIMRAKSEGVRVGHVA